MKFGFINLQYCKLNEEALSSKNVMTKKAAQEYNEVNGTHITMSIFWGTMYVNFVKRVVIDRYHYYCI